MALFSLTSLSDSELSDGFTIVIPTIAPSKKSSTRNLNKPPPSPNQKALARRQSPSRDLVSRRDDRSSRMTRARSSSRERDTVTSATTRSTLSSFTASSYRSRRVSRRSRSPTERTWSYTYDSDASSEETIEDDDVDGYSRPGGSLYHVHGRTDVLPALPVEPYSAFLAAYRLVHLVGTSRPRSPDSMASSTALQPPAGQSGALPVHLLPTFTPTEKRARRLALLMDSDDPDVQDWSMLEFAKLSRSGRDLVRFGVFEMPARPASPVDTEDEPISDFDDASVSEAGGINWPWNRRPKRTREEDEQRGAALEALAARLENSREAAEEREELDREQAWARETFGRWLRDGRADGVFKEAVGVLDALLRTMAREDGEEWALASPPQPAPPPPPPVEITPAPATEDGTASDEHIDARESVSLEAVAKVGTVATDEVTASDTETEHGDAIPAASGPEPVTPFDAPISTALALATPLVLATATPEVEKTLDDMRPKYSPPIALAPESQPSDPVEQQDTGEFAAAIISATRPAFKYMNSAGLPVPPTPPTYITPAAPAPKPPSPPPPTAISLSPPKALPAPESIQESSAASTVPAPPKPNFLADTSSPALPADDEDKYSSYSGFYNRDPRRARDDRPIRPHPAYNAARFGGPQPTPEQVFGSYADFYKGRSVAGSVVSRKSARSVKSSKSVRREKESKGKEKEREREKEKEREREREKEREREREKEKERERERQKKKEKERERTREKERERAREREREERERERKREKEREEEKELERQRAKDKDKRKDADARSHVSRKPRRSPSPARRRDSSPTRRKRDSSPRRRDSSRRREPSPRRRDSSPRRRDSSPRRRNPSPHRRESPTRRRDSSPRRRDRDAPTTSRKRSSSREHRHASPPPRLSGKEKMKAKRPSTPTDDLEDIAVSSRISLETGRLTTPGPSRSPSPEPGGATKSERRPRPRRRSSAGLTTPPQSIAPRSPSPSPPPKGKGKRSGKAQRLRGGAGSPSPPRRRFGLIAPPPPPSEATAEPLLTALEAEAGPGEGADEADGEAAFPPLPPLPPIQFWMPPPARDDSDSDTEVEGDKRAPPVFLALGARRACVPYTPAFQGLDTRVVRPVSARERLALRDAAAVLVRLGAKVEKEAVGADMWSLSYVRF